MCPPKLVKLLGAGTALLLGASGLAQSDSDARPQHPNAETGATDSGTEMTWKPGPGQLVREGSFLRNRRGRLVRGEGTWVYVFDKDAQGNAEPPMVMSPCRRLREMQQALELQARTLTFQTTGQVFAYEGRNYFLPTFFGVIAAERIASPPEAEASAPTSRDPSGADLVREMSGGARPAVTPRANGGNGRLDASAEPMASLREGITIVSRRGRVVRDAGQLSFVTDNDAGQSGKPEPALTLMPCMNLEAIERIVNRRGDQAVLTMSGRIFAYEGRNHLLPTFFVEEPDREGNLIPAQ
jgi:hypothetical protein